MFLEAEVKMGLKPESLVGVVLEKGKGVMMSLYFNFKKEKKMKNSYCFFYLSLKNKTW